MGLKNKFLIFGGGVCAYYINKKEHIEFCPKNN